MMPYLRVANVHDERIDYADVLSMNFTPAEQKRYALLPGDILLNEGQSLELVGRSAIYEGIPGEYCFQNSIVCFRTHPGVCTPRFVAAVFKRWLDLGRFMTVARQTTSMAHLGADRFARMWMPRPPFPEQSSIAEKYTAVQRQLSDERTNLEKLRLLKKGLMDDLLTGRVRVPLANGAA